MTTEQFETLSLYVCVGGLILYMFFIMWRLAKDSEAGKFGTLMIFVVLGLGVLGFIIKEVLVLTLDI